MLRLALIAIVFVIIIGSIVFASRAFLLNKSTSDSAQTAPREVPLSTESGQLTNQVHDLIEQSQKPLQVETQQTLTSTQVADLTSRIKILETTITDLRAQLRTLQTTNQSSTTTTTSTTTSNPPSYIPLNFNGQLSGMSYATLPNQSLTINPADYPGYSSMVLIVQLQVYQGNGTAYAQLVNTANNNVVPGSEVSTGNYEFTQLASSSFNLPAGSQPYGIQLKTTTGYSAIIQSAMIKVNF